MTPVLEPVHVRAGHVIASVVEACARYVEFELRFRDARAYCPFCGAGHSASDDRFRSCAALATGADASVGTALAVRHASALWHLKNRR